MCRKSHGAAFGTCAKVLWPAFEFTKGEKLVTAYQSSETITRTFCGQYGSTLQFIPDDQPGFGIAVGTLDDDPIKRPTEQIYVGDKAPWWDLTEEPPCYETYPAQKI